MSYSVDHTLAVTGAISIAEVADLLPQLQTRMPSGDVTVNLASADHVDSASVSLLLHLARQVINRGDRFRLINVPAALSSLVDLYGVDSLLEAEAKV